MARPKDPRSFANGAIYAALCKTIADTGEKYVQRMGRSAAFTFRADFNEWRKKMQTWPKQRLEKFETLATHEIESLRRLEDQAQDAKWIICKLKEEPNGEATITLEGRMMTEPSTPILDYLRKNAIDPEIRAAFLGEFGGENN
jgi:hypothetical protein